MRRGRIALIVAATGAVLPSFGIAETWTFNGGGSPWTNTWQVPGNWNPNSIPNASGAAAIFPAAAIAGGSGTVSINAGASVTVGQLNFTGNNLNGYTLDGPGKLTVAGAGTITINAGVATINSSFTMPTNSSITKAGSGVLVLAGPGSFSGFTGITISGGTLRVTNSNVISSIAAVSTANDGQLELQNVTASGTLTILGLGGSTPPVTGALYSSAGNNSWNGNWFALGSAASVGVAPGTTLTQLGNIFDGAGTAANGFTKVGGGTLVVGSLGLTGPLHIDSGTVVLANNSGTASHLAGAVNIAGGTAAPIARLDVTTKKLVVRNANVDSIKSYLSSGENDGDWNGLGITSSIAAADALANGGTTSLAVGYVRGSELASFNGSTATFGGATLSANDVALALTHVGDTNLDGMVDIGSDFSNFLAGYTAPLSFLSNTDWNDGDFNHDGVIDLNQDFTAFATGYVTTGAPFAALTTAIGNSGLPTQEQQTMQNIAVSVPEPGTIAWLASLSGLLSIRRRR